MSRFESDDEKECEHEYEMRGRDKSCVKCGARLNDDGGYQDYIYDRECDRRNEEAWDKSQDK